MKQYLTFYNYKEPLIKIKGGYGYLGVICGTVDGKKIQCHKCGKLFTALTGHTRHHGLTVSQYKQKYQLARKTALVSENERAIRKHRTLEWLKSLTPRQLAQYKANGRRGLLTQRKMNHAYPQSLETKNKRGSCPDQLLEKIKQVKKQLNKTPTYQEFIDQTGSQRYTSLIQKTFGTWNKAVILADSKPNSHDGGGFRHHTDDQLLDYLRSYAEDNRTLPTITDCKRKLIPSFYTYVRRFGSFENARQLAGCYDFLN